MSQYAELDRLVLIRLADVGAGTRLPLSPLDTREIRAEAVRLANATGRKSFRVLDGRLQALRKSGQVRFDSKAGWCLG